MWALCVVGARVTDLNRLESVQFEVQGNVVYVDFRTTKSSRTAAEAFSVELPTWIPFNPNWDAMAKEPRPFTANCDRFNRVLYCAGYIQFPPLVREPHYRSVYREGNHRMVEGDRGNRS